MNRQSQYKKKFNPETYKFTRENIYGEGIVSDILKVFGKTAKKAMAAAATKTGEYAGKKAGDKIVQMLSKGNTPKKNTSKKII